MASVLKSKFKELEPVEEKTLPEYLLAKAKLHVKNGRDLWIVDGLTGEERHYPKFEEETRKISSSFYKLGLRKGDTVIYMIRDLCKVYILLSGVWRANGVMRASYPDDDSSTILSRVQESKVRFIVCEEDALEMLQDVRKKAPWNVQIITTNRNDKGFPSIHNFLEDDGTACPELTLQENDPAVILCTSGTTGMPKGAVITHKGLLYQIRALENLGYSKDKPNLIASKATHVSGTTFGFIIFDQGKTALVVSDVTQENILNAAHKYKPGLAFAFPTFLMAMSGPEAENYDFSSIDTIMSGGVSITPSIRKALLKVGSVKDVISLYGLTETILCTTNASLQPEEVRITVSDRELPDFSVGKVYPGVSLQIRDTHEENLKILGPGEKGEICVKSEGMFHSYLNNPEATEKAFVDGHFRTGDIGYYDKDGYVFVVDRSKEIFKYYNNHISPSELENVIGSHPKVREVCVVGIANEGGQIPRAFVTLQDPKEGAKGQELAEEIKEFANANLASYKQLRGGLFIVDDLPKGKTGKITRQLVEKLELPNPY